MLIDLVIESSTSKAASEFMRCLRSLGSQIAAAAARC